MRRIKGFAQVIFLVIVLVVILLSVIVYLRINKRALYQDQSNNYSPSQNANVTPQSFADEIANWRLYQNHNLEFKYPNDWTVNYDTQPDPLGNPTKYSVTVGLLNVVILTSDQFKTFADLQNISNLPSGTATIISKREVLVGEQRALYLVQNNNREGVVVLDLKHNLVFMEVGSKNKDVLNKIISTVKFSSCSTCPQLSPPGPNFCSNGKIIPGRIDECGCQMPPSCSY